MFDRPQRTARGLNSASAQALALARVSLKPGDTRASPSTSPLRPWRAAWRWGCSSSGWMSSVTLTRSPCVVDLDFLVQRGVQLLLVPPHELGGGLHQRVEGRGVQRLGVLLVAAHGPGADQRRLDLAVRRHGHGPAVVVLVLDHRAVQPLSRHRRGSWAARRRGAQLVLLAGALALDAAAQHDLMPASPRSEWTRAGAGGGFAAAAAAAARTGASTGSKPAT
jgi:hypothetical protein